MALLKYRNEVPPSGFWYLQKETRLRVTGDNLKDLVLQVIAHRKHRGLEPTDFDTVALEVERQICSRLGDFHCKPEKGEENWTPVTLDSTVLKASNVASFSRAAWEWIKSGRELVPEEQAKERAAKCAQCPINWPLTGCKCGSLYRLIERGVPKEKRFEGLGVCAICQCSLPAKVWLPRNVINSSNEGRNLRFPQDGSCWQADPEG